MSKLNVHSISGEFDKRNFFFVFNSNVSLLDKYIFKFCILIFITANEFSAIGIFIIIVKVKAIF
jgi:hypothetical protein